MARSSYWGRFPRDARAWDPRDWIARRLAFVAGRFRDPPGYSLVADVVAALNRYDPVQLIALCAREDEYEHEAREIATWMPWVLNEQEMAALVFEVFYKAFHIDIPGEEPDDEYNARDDPATYAPIARDLMDVWRRHFPGLEDQAAGDRSPL